MLRGSLDRVGELLEVPAGHGLSFGLAYTIARLDALAAVRNRRRVEEEAPLYLQPGSIVEPFALRALGAVREDEELLGRALERFEAMGLSWHAEQTASLR